MVGSRTQLQAMQKQEKLGAYQLRLYPHVSTTKSGNSPRFNRGVIVNVASMYGVIVTSLNVRVVSYTAAKHGVIGLTKADALTYSLRRDINSTSVFLLVPGRFVCRAAASVVRGGEAGCLGPAQTDRNPESHHGIER